MDPTIDQPCLRIDLNVQRLSNFVDHFLTMIQSYRDQLEMLYHDYLENHTTTPRNEYQPISENKNVETIEFKKIDDIYKKLMKELQGVSELITEDQNHLKTIGSGLCIIFKEIANIQKTINSPNSLGSNNKLQTLNILKSKLTNSSLKFNQLAVKYNEQVLKFDNLKLYLERGIITYSSSTSNQNYLILISEEMEKFKNLINPDETSKLKSEIIQQLFTESIKDVKDFVNHPVTPIELINIKDENTPILEQRKRKFV